MSNEPKRGPLVQVVGVALLGAAALATYAIVSSDPARDDPAARAANRAAELARTRAAITPRSGAALDERSEHPRGEAPRSHGEPSEGSEPSDLAEHSPAPSSAGASPASGDESAEPPSTGSGHPGVAAPLDAGLRTGEPGPRPRAVPSGLLPRRVAETPPELTLRRWEAMQHVVEDRITLLEEDLARHRQAGDTARAARAERLIRDLEARRPGLNERIAQLRREQASTNDPAEDPPSP